MKGGKFADGEHIIRAKIDMASLTLTCVIQSCFESNMSHIKEQEMTGVSISCMILVTRLQIDRITHSLCTLEFEDPHPSYDWVIKKILPTGLIAARLQQIEFSCLNIKYVSLCQLFY